MWKKLLLPFVSAYIGMREMNFCTRMFVQAITRIHKAMTTIKVATITRGCQWNRTAEWKKHKQMTSKVLDEIHQIYATTTAATASAAQYQHLLCNEAIVNEKKKKHTHTHAHRKRGNEIRIERARTHNQPYFRSLLTAFCQYLQTNRFLGPSAHLHLVKVQYRVIVITTTNPPQIIAITWCLRRLF